MEVGRGPAHHPGLGWTTEIDLVRASNHRERGIEIRAGEQERRAARPGVVTTSGAALGHNRVHGRFECVELLRLTHAGGGLYGRGFLDLLGSAVVVSATGEQKNE